MPHEVVIESERFAVDDDALDIAGPIRARIHGLESGDALVIVGGDATRDGRPFVGHLTRIDCGGSALLRIGGRRLEIKWRAGGGARKARAGERCRVCLRSLRADQTVTACSCEAALHDECMTLVATCPACGAPGRRTDA